MTSHESRLTHHDRAAAALCAAHWCTIAALVALTFLCLLWESLLAPLRPGGSLLMLKALPLLLPLFGLPHERLIVYKWTVLLALPYLAEGVVRAYADTGLSRQLAMGEIGLALTLFAGSALYVRLPRSGLRS